MSPPCRICGQEDHTIIKETRDEYGYKRHEYACPVALYDDWNEAIKLAHNGNKYRISPLKLARLYDYDLARIENALFKFKHDGSGKYMSVKTNDYIQLQVQAICEQHKRDMAKLKRESMDLSHLPIIYCGLDGVLADFDYKVKNTFEGRSPEQIFPEEMWERIASYKHFFHDLPWTRDGLALWDAIRYLTPYILTEVPKIKYAEQDKRSWVNWKLGPEVVMLACQLSNKHLYCRTPGSILIDDNESARRNWELTGGKFILHTNSLDTIKQLQQLGIPVDLPNNIYC